MEIAQTTATRITTAELPERLVSPDRTSRTSNPGFAQGCLDGSNEVGREKLATTPPDDRPLAPVVSPVTGTTSTDSGFFHHIPAIICGPGDIPHGHKPEKSIADSHLGSCNRLVGGRAGRLLL